jgi:hypothetical protein
MGFDIRFRGFFLSYWKTKVIEFWIAVVFSNVFNSMATTIH